MNDGVYKNELEKILRLPPNDRLSYLGIIAIYLNPLQLNDICYKLMAQNAIDFTNDYFNIKLLKSLESVNEVDKLLKRYASCITSHGIICNDEKIYYCFLSSAKLLRTDVNALLEGQLRKILYDDVAKKYGSFVGEVLINFLEGVWVPSDTVDEKSDHSWIAIYKNTSIPMGLDPIGRAYRIIKGESTQKMMDFFI